MYLTMNRFKVIKGQEEAFEESVWSISAAVHEEARFEYPEGEWDKRAEPTLTPLRDRDR